MKLENKRLFLSFISMNDAQEQKKKRPQLQYKLNKSKTATKAYSEYKPFVAFIYLFYYDASIVNLL